MYFHDRLDAARALADALRAAGATEKDTA